jgi:arginase family enzyme
MGMAQRVKVFGSSLDALDGEEKVALKRAYINALIAKREPYPNFLDPYEALINFDPVLTSNGCIAVGGVPTESWVTPKPLVGDLPAITSDAYRQFLEGNGCRRYADITGNVVARILPGPFVMIGVDHSLTGGVVRALSERLSPERLSLIVLDAHLDIFDFELLYPAQQKLMANQGYGSYAPEPYRNSFYGCGNFLKYLLAENSILPENLFVVGVNDYPGNISEHEKDPDIGPYVQAHRGVVERGVHVVPRAEAESSKGELAVVLSRINTPYVYVSIDLDVGAFSATRAVRFLNTVGMEESAIYRTVEAIRDVIETRHVSCVGFDLMEMDVHFAETVIGGVRDRSYEIASHIMGILLPVLTNTCREGQWKINSGRTI